MNPDGPGRQRLLRDSFIAFALIFASLFLSHIALLRLPYFWDEAGYFIPAARDVLLTGSLIPHSTLSNAHPPLVMIWLAFWWKCVSFDPIVTRTAMLLVAAFALAGVWRLSRAVAANSVALATVVCTALYPVFFAQSSLAHLDMMAAALTIWGLVLYVEGRFHGALVFFALAPVAKETAIVTPLALFAWELMSPFLPDKITRASTHIERSVRQKASFLLCVVPIAIWLAYHRYETGYLFGNPEFLRYNVGATIAPLRVLLAFLTRLGQLLCSLNLFVLTLGAAYAMSRPALPGRDGLAPPRIIANVQLVLTIVILAYLVLLSIFGGAVLARYFVPVYPLVILLCISTLQRRVRFWKWWVAAACAAFLFALVTPPPYRVAPEDTLLYRNFVQLHKQAADVIAARYPQARVLTAWPASGELTEPYLGYIKQPVQVTMRLEDFSESEILRAAQAAGQFDIAMMFSTKWEPPHPLLPTLLFGKALHERFFDYHKDVIPQRAAELLGGRIVWERNWQNEWVAIIEIEKWKYAALQSAK
jgi:hypothetical protein